MYLISLLTYLDLLRNRSYNIHPQFIVHSLRISAAVQPHLLMALNLRPGRAGRYLNHPSETSSDFAPR